MMARERNTLLYPKRWTKTTALSYDSNVIVIVIFYWLGCLAGQ